MDDYIAERLTKSTGNVGGSAGRLHSLCDLPTESPASAPVDTKAAPKPRNLDRHKPGYYADYMRKRRAKQRDGK